MKSSKLSKSGNSASFSNSSYTSDSGDETKTSGSDYSSKSNSRRNSSTVERIVKHLKKHTSWEDYNEEVEQFIQSCPKLELHVHLDGSFDLEFLWNYLEKTRPSIFNCLPVDTGPLPWWGDNPPKSLQVRKLVQDCNTFHDFHNLCTCRGKRSLNEMLDCFTIFTPIVRSSLILNNMEELLEELAYDFAKRQYEQNIIYTEVRYSPQLFLPEQQLSEEQEGNENDKDSNRYKLTKKVFNVITKGLRRGCKDFGNIIINQILCGIAWNPEWANDIVELANEYKNDYPCAVVGIDIAAGEEHFDSNNFPQLYEPHYNMIQKAKEYNLNITLHAGETVRDIALTNIKQAISSKYSATRIGHGYRMTRSKELMKQIQEQNIHIEVCPTSSVETGGWIYDNNENPNNDENNQQQKAMKKNWKKHPCVTMLENNISFSFSSDDPAVFHTSLAWQYRIGLQKIGLTKQQLINTIFNAVDAAFCSDEQKQKLTSILKEFLASECNSADNVHQKKQQKDFISSSSSSFSSSSENINSDHLVHVFKDRVRDINC